MDIPFLTIGIVWGAFSIFHLIISIFYIQRFNKKYKSKSNEVTIVALVQSVLLCPFIICWPILIECYKEGFFTIKEPGR